MLRAFEVYLLLRTSSPSKADTPRATPRGCRDFLAYYKRLWSQTDSHVLRAELGVRIADKTVLKIMREMGIRCRIRRETDYHRYSSYKGVVGKTFENVIGRDFSADGPWKKMGTDVTEFKQPWGKAYFAPVYDFGSKEIVAWNVARGPNMVQQKALLRSTFSEDT